MYVFDTNIFIYLDNIYPKRFPSLWKRLDELVQENKLWSVREAHKEVEFLVRSDHVAEWVNKNKRIFKKPESEDEIEIITDIFKRPQYRDFVRKDQLLKGSPVADPFIIASAKVNNASIVTQEKLAKNGAKIPNACRDFDIKCINMEQFLENENLTF